jgi:hypothetical protein
VINGILIGLILGSIITIAANGTKTIKPELAQSNPVAFHALVRINLVKDTARVIALVVGLAAFCGLIANLI